MSIFGAKIRESFSFPPGSVPICHGSYGAIPNSILEKRFSLLKEVASNPDAYYRQSLYPRWQHNLKCICDDLKLNYDNTVFVDNTTKGMNCVIRSIDWQKGDKILANSTTYPAVYQTCFYILQTKGVELIKVDMTPPLTKDVVVSRYQEVLKNQGPFKLAILDAISSSTATRYPLEELVALLKSYDVIVAIDAAHAPGQIDVDVEALDPDFYVGNLHKWMFVPLTVAVFWINKKHHDLVAPNAISYFQNKGLHMSFYWQGTADYTQHLCVEDSIAFYNDIGGKVAVKQYITTLLDEAVSYLCDLWNTEKYPLSKDLEAPFLRGILMPKLPNYPPPDVPKGALMTDHSPLMTALFQNHQIAALITVIHGLCVIRLSGNVYNTMDDYKTLGQVVLDLKNEALIN